METVTDFIFLGSKVIVDSHEIKRCLHLGRKAMTNLDSILKSKHIAFLTKVCMTKVMAFSVSCMDVRAVVLEKTLESPLDCKEIKPVNPGGNQR